MSVSLTMKRMQKVIFFATGVMLLAASALAAPAFAQQVVTGTATVGSGVSGSGTISVSSIPAQYCPSLYGQLYMGSRGSQVSALQQFLNNRYGNQPVTGYFGSITRANVLRFQQEFGVSAVGIVGPLTRGKIQQLCTGGSTGGNTGGGAATSLSASPTYGMAPLTVAFTGELHDNNTYIIDYGDGQNSGPIQATCYPSFAAPAVCQIRPSHTYTSAGTYTANLSSYIACQYTNPRCMIATQTLGQATITVGAQTVGGVTVTSPNAGQTYSRGQDMVISWSYPVTPNSVPMAIELYTSAGVRIGLIAVSNDTIGSYTWHIPGFPQNYMCTMQYPNALCGTSIPNGQYYVKVTAEQDPLGANPTPIASNQSGVFTMTGAQ